MNSIILSDIIIYPVKSCKGISLRRVYIGPNGAAMDRRWMIVDEKGECVSQRSAPQLAMVHTALDERFLMLSVPAQTPFMLALDQIGRPTRAVFMGKSYDVLDMGHSVAKWLSAFLHQPVRLVYQPDPRLGFFDKMPLHLISEASLSDLISRLGDKIRMNRFRPNLVVKTALPYEEDSWKRIQIGDVSFRLERPCTRAVVPTINQETAQKNCAPIEVLSTFHKQQFGQLLVHENQGMIEVGQSVKRLESPEFA